MSPRDRLAVLEFGRSTRLLAPLGDPRLVRVDPARAGADPGGTDIAGGLTTRSACCRRRTKNGSCC